VSYSSQGGEEAVRWADIRGGLWRVLKSLATYVEFDIYVAKDWACVMDSLQHCPHQALASSSLR